jgi:hypothetical protein
MNLTGNTILITFAVPDFLDCDLFELYSSSPGSQPTPISGKEE